MKLIDRYILRQYIATLLFALTALCVIFLVVNLLENLDDFMDRNTPAGVIVQYYINFFPEIIKLLTPVAMLLASLFTVGKLANNNEITAMKSGGMSIYRMMIPLVTLSILVSIGQLYFNGWIVPVSNQKKAESSENTSTAVGRSVRCTICISATLPHAMPCCSTTTMFQKQGQRSRSKSTRPKSRPALSAGWTLRRSAGIRSRING